MDTITLSTNRVERVQIEHFICRTCSDVLPIALHEFGYCLNCHPRIEYFYCLVCSTRLPERRRYHGTHEECAHYYHPEEKGAYTRARMSIVEKRRRQVADLMAGNVPPREIAEILGVSIGTVQNDLHHLRARNA